jgi:hypothetical protein
VSLDHIKLHRVRAALHARQSKWQAAENDMRQAISLADREEVMDVRVRARILEDYATVLRKLTGS